jgi:hypothetical protein
MSDRADRGYVKAGDEDLRLALARYVDLCANLSRERIPELRELCSPDVHFRDPFNDVRGIELFEKCMDKMFEDVGEPRFDVHDSVFSQQHQEVAYLRWTFHCRLPVRGHLQIEGMTEVQFDHQALVAAHLDHWDSGRQLYEKLPGIGFVLRRVRKRLAIKEAR